MKLILDPRWRWTGILLAVNDTRSARWSPNSLRTTAVAYDRPTKVKPPNISTETVTTMLLTFTQNMTHSHLAPRLKKEYSYTSTPPLGLRGLF